MVIENKKIKRRLLIYEDIYFGKTIGQQKLLEFISTKSRLPTVMHKKKSRNPFAKATEEEEAAILAEIRREGKTLCSGCGKEISFKKGKGGSPTWEIVASGIYHKSCKKKIESRYKKFKRLGIEI